MIADTDSDAGIFKTKFFKNWQQQTAERNFACGDKYGSVLQIFAFRNFGFARFDVVKRYSYMFKKFFALGRQLHTSVCAGEKGTSECAFEVFDGSRQVRLIVHQLF